MEPTTPKQITDIIRVFCKEIDPSQEPLFVKVIPGEGCLPNCCMTNVPEYKKLNGGDIQYGWIIWEAPGQLLDAEFHAVWRRPDGSLVDLTPTMDGEKSILFLPDSKRVYEHQLVENIRKPLSDSPEVIWMIEVSRILFNIRSKHFRDDKIDAAAVESELEGMSSELRSLRDEIFKAKTKKPGRNKPCPCGSGRKYKKCCGR
jgi:hypothetical protein